MKKNNENLVKKITLLRLVVSSLIVLWALFLISLFYYNYKGMEKWTLKLAETEAWASYNKDVLYRKWAASHGGVYVPPTEKTPPSPYLSHISDRDIISTEGKKLTLINPAYMTREVHELGEKEYRSKGHITSLQPIRPGNEPDQWEEKVLKKFNKGVEEYSELVTNENNEKVLRGMRPLKVGKGCLKCHQYQGYKVGDIRGGLSVEVSMKPYEENLKNQVINEVILFLIIWILGNIAVITAALFYYKNIQIVYNNSIKHQTLERQLQQAQKMEAVGQLAGGIAHDFNNLLGIIIGFADLIHDEVSKESSINKYSENILKTGERAKELITQISIFSRQKDIKIDFLDINNLIEDFLRLLKRTIGEHINVEFKKGFDPLKTIGDKTQIEQVIMNLCVNARDAIGDDGKIVLETDYKEIDNEFCTTHAWAKPGEYIVIKVSDTGKGMDSDTLSRIYEPFFSTKEVGKGTGLGLSVAFGIIQKHNGFINVYSVPEHGTIFSVFLPVAKEKISKVKEDTTVKKDYNEKNYGTILIAEDEDLLREMISGILSSAGFNIFVAKNGKEAIDLFNKNADEIDMLLFDVMMPVMGGLKAYSKISDIKKGVPVLFASGYSSESISNELLNANEYNMIWKPFGRDELLNKIKEILNDSK